uniref:WD repeat domain 46 n=1 Tax=Hucho hucho TaxID=62062 RepID=A0A4W5MRP3_9TELE
IVGKITCVMWLHSEAMFTVAQKKWLYIYDIKGIELHFIRKFNDGFHMQFLPYHFLLATSATGFLQYLDVLDVMAHNPHNAIIHLGHSNGTVTLWTPNQREPLVKMLCHQGGVRSVTIDKTGTYMVTSGMDKRLKVYDIRSYRPLLSYFLPVGASCLSLSQRGLLSAATGDIVQVIHCMTMAYRAKGSVWVVDFCPVEDVLSVGHVEGFTSMVPIFDGLEANLYPSAKQRQEWEIKALLEKIQTELVGLDPSKLSQVDHSTWEKRHEDRVQALGFYLLAKEKFMPILKTKGRSSSGKVEKRKKQVIDKERKKKEAATAGQKSIEHLWRDLKIAVQRQIHR